MKKFVSLLLAAAAACALLFLPASAAAGAHPSTKSGVGINFLPGKPVLPPTGGGGGGGGNGGGRPQRDRNRTSQPGDTVYIVEPGTPPAQGHLPKTGGAPE